MPKIACISASQLENNATPQGFSSVPTWLRFVLDSGDGVEFRERSELENDPTWKQIIPYIVLYRRNDPMFGMKTYLTYRRGGGQGEERLHGKRSIGIGGHVEDKDMTTGVFATGWEKSMYRELNEEVKLTARNVHGMPVQPGMMLYGMLNDDSNDVGKVHLGLVYVADATALSAAPNEPDMLNFEWRPAINMYDDAVVMLVYEKWSELVLGALVKNESF